jgi:uncharacterized membrane protein
MRHASPLALLSTGSAVLSTVTLTVVWGSAIHWMPLFVVLLPLWMAHAGVTLVAVLQVRRPSKVGGRRVAALLAAGGFLAALFAVLPLFGRGVFALVGLIPTSGSEYWFADETFAANLPVLAAWVVVVVTSVVQAGAALVLLGTPDHT